MKRILPFITVLALAIGAPLANAHHKDDGECPHAMRHKLHHLKKAVFTKILKDSGVEDETINTIFAKVKELKMKIKHEIKEVLQDELNADQKDDGESPHAMRIRAMSCRILTALRLENIYVLNP